MVLQPRPQLLRAHPVDARSTGVLLDTSARLGQVPVRESNLPQALNLSAVSIGTVRRRIVAALWQSVLGLHLWTLPARPPEGLAAVNATITRSNVPTLGITFGPSQPTTNPSWYYGLC
jgi:hypothetical protein